MSALYSLDVLRLAADTGATARLTHPDATVERRSSTCGSRITVDVALGPDGRIDGYGHEVRACALGQAAATLVARNIVGATADDVERARDLLTGYLAGRDDNLPEWPGIESLAKARDYPARHPSIRLAIEAVAEAIHIAAKVPAR